MIDQEMKYPGSTRVLVWRLEEDAPQLLALCRQQGIPCDDLLDQPVKRQREKAAERLLLCQAFGRPVTLSHDQQGAPLIEDEKANISITHTMHLVAVALNDNHVIGLDAEQIDRRQVLRVRDKFLNSSDQQFIKPDDLAAHIIAWTAKEAVIKAERNSAIDWTEGIRLEPFVPNSDETTLIAHCGGNRYDLTTRPSEGHYLTIAIPATD
jgi:phosphopantetheinyl transferase (holo-ACP synthase)